MITDLFLRKELTLWCGRYLLLIVTERVAVERFVWQGADLLGGQKDSCLGHSGESEQNKVEKIKTKKHL